MNENEIVKSKNNKGIIVLVIFLVLLVIGMGSYIVYDKINDESDKKVVEEKDNDNENDETIDITDSKLATDLEKSLISNDNVNGLYASDEVSISDKNNETLILFNLKKYKEDNKLEYANEVPYLDESGNPIGFLKLTIKKTDFNKYMQEKYNVNYEYDYNLNANDIENSSIFGNCITLFTDEENYKFVEIGSSCSSVNIKTKLIKAEKEEDEVEIYDKAVSCDEDFCFSTVDSTEASKAILDCSNDNKSNGTCSNLNNSEEMAKYAIDNLSDKLNTFKHTFKKASDGNYYYEGTEIED